MIDSIKKHESYVKEIL